MADKLNKTPLDNAVALVKENLPEGEIGYAVSDGQAFYRSKSQAERKVNAERYAFRTHPAKEIKEVKGTKKITKKESK